MATGGLIGVGEDGLKPGEGIEIGGKVGAELTGQAAMTRAMERETELAEARLAEEEELRKQAMAQDALDAERADRRASNVAAATTASANINQNNFLGL